MDELGWIGLAQQGDIEAFNHLVSVHQDRMYSQAFWIIGESQAAEDLTQEALVKAFCKLKSYRGGSFKGWLLRIVTNVCLDEMRRNKHLQILPLENKDDGKNLEAIVELTDRNPSVEESVEQAELNKAVHHCIDQLAPKFKQVVILVDLQGLDYAEAAASMEVSIGTVKSRLARGRMKLRNVLCTTLDVNYLPHSKVSIFGNNGISIALDQSTYSS